MQARGHAIDAVRQRHPAHELERVVPHAELRDFPRAVFHGGVRDAGSRNRHRDNRRRVDGFAWCLTGCDDVFFFLLCVVTV